MNYQYRVDQQDGRPMVPTFTFPAGISKLTIKKGHSDYYIWNADGIGPTYGKTPGQIYESENLRAWVQSLANKRLTSLHEGQLFGGGGAPELGFTGPSKFGVSQVVTVNLFENPITTDADFTVNIVNDGASKGIQFSDKLVFVLIAHYKQVHSRGKHNMIQRRIIQHDIQNPYYLV